MVDLAHVRRALLDRRASTIADDAPRAAVAAVLRGERRPELLLIERAARAGDPWSGQMALPGGRAEPGDDSDAATARRETREEVGLDLAAGTLLGRLDDQAGRPRGAGGGLVIAAFVFELPPALPPALRTSPEVEAALWVPLDQFLLRERHVDYRYPSNPEVTFPGVVVGDPERHVVWGLTYRFLAGFFDALGVRFPPSRHE